MPRTTQTRRRFLKSTVAMSVPWLLAPGARGANDRIALGCLGTGGRGTYIMKAFLAVKDVQVVAVCDVQASRREAARKIAGGKGILEHSDFREVLALENVDAVLIAPQDHWHGPMAVAAATAGKDMYCEKPLGVSVAEGQAIRAAVRRYARVFQTGTQQRSSTTFRGPRDLVLSGKLGKIHTVKVGAPGPRYQRKYRGSLEPQPVPAGLDWEMYVGPAPMKPYNPGHMAWPDWYFIWDYCAGFIVNWGVHHLDIAHWGCPSIGRTPFEITCKGTYRNDGFTDNISGWQADLRFQDGLKMTYTDTGHPNGQGCRFEGDEGWVWCNRSGIWASSEALKQEAKKPRPMHGHSSNHHPANFIEAVRTRRDPVAPVEAGHVASTLGLVAEIAARTKRTLKWDWKKEQFAGDDGANRQLSRTLRSPWTL